MLESSGLPLPGEAILLAAAAYAGSTHHLGIVGVVAAAAGGAILGDNFGYLVGGRIGLPLLKRYGPRVRLPLARLRLAQHLFNRFGGRIVFFGRFVAVLRAFAALLAGANRYPWGRFLLFNAAGGVTWATLYGTAADLFGAAIHRFAGPVGIVLAIAVVLAAVAAALLLRRHAAGLQAEADRTVTDL